MELNPLAKFGLTGRTDLTSWMSSTWEWSPGGHSKKFDRDARVIFWGLKFHNLLFFWVAQNEGYFSGLEKISINFFG